MAHVVSFPVDTAHHSNGFLAAITKAVADYRLYLRTLGELRSLSERELRDLGISRFSIREIAYESVYGR